MLKFITDAPLPSEIPSLPTDGAILLFFSPVTILLFLANPTDIERQAIESEKLRIAVNCVDYVPFLCFRTRSLPWQEIAIHYSAIEHEDRPTQEELEELQNNQKWRKMLCLCLVDSTSRIVVANRSGTLSNEVSSYLVEKILETRSQYEVNAYHGAVTAIYDRYPVGAIAKNAPLFCKIGD